MYSDENWTHTKQVRNNWKVSECGAGEGWRRTVVPIISEMMKCYKESEGGEEYSIDNKMERLTGLVTSCLETAF